MTARYTEELEAALAAWEEYDDYVMLVTLEGTALQQARLLDLRFPVTDAALAGTDRACTVAGCGGRGTARRR